MNGSTDLVLRDSRRPRTTPWSSVCGYLLRRRACSAGRDLVDSSGQQQKSHQTDAVVSSTGYVLHTVHVAGICSSGRRPTDSCNLSKSVQVSVHFIQIIVNQMKQRTYLRPATDLSAGGGITRFSVSCSDKCSAYYESGRRKHSCVGRLSMRILSSVPFGSRSFQSPLSKE
jgi:hypothetical protein